MEALRVIGLAILVTCTMAMLDFAHAQYTLAMQHLRPYNAAMWSVIQWGAGAISFVVAVRISVWYLPFESVGLAIGTVLGCRRRIKGVKQA